MAYPSLASWLAGIEVAELDVVRLSPPKRDATLPRGWVPRGWLTCHRLSADERARCLELVGALPPGDVARCHHPTFGLRVNPGVAEILVSLCFNCQNAYAGDQLLSFDAASPAATALLELLRSYAPPGTGEPG